MINVFEPFFSINCNVDLIIGGAHLMTNLNLEPGGSADHESINSFNEFQETFSHFFSQGAPAERFVANKEVFQQAVKMAENDQTAEVSLYRQRSPFYRQTANAYVSFVF